MASERKIAALVELERRGKLPPRQQAALNELRARGLVGQQQVQQQAQAPQVPFISQANGDAPQQELTREQVQAGQELTPIAHMIAQSEQRIAARQAQERGTALDIFTGESRVTPEIEGLQEVGAAPELNEFSLKSLRTAAGLLTTGKDKELRSIFKKQFGDDVSFKDDAKGNTIVNLPSGEYVLNAPGLSGQDLIRGAFDIAAFTPAGAARTVLGGAAKSAATEAGIEGAEQQLGGDFSAEDVAIASALGGGLKAVEKGVEATGRFLRGKSTSEIVDAGREAGIDVLTSDVIQPKTWAGRFLLDQANKTPLGTGAARAEQQLQREEAIKRFEDFYGASSYDEILNSLSKQRERLKKGSGKVLGDVRDEMDALGPIALPKTQAAIAEASEALNKEGIIRSEKGIADLDLVVRALGEGQPTFSSVRELRGTFNEIVDQVDAAGRSQLTSRPKALLKKVESAMKADMKDMAKANLPEAQYLKWLKANEVYSSEAKNLTKTKLKTLLDKKDIKPEVVEGMLFSTTPSEMKLLHSSLGVKGKQNARAAIVNRMFNKLETRAAGATPTTLANELKKELPRIKIFFKGRQLDEIKGLLKVLDNTREAQAASVLTQTGQQAAGFGAQVSLAVAPIRTLVAGLSMGKIAQIYESPLVRDALLRVQAAPKTKRQELINKALLELQTAAQAVKDEEIAR